MKRTWWIAPAVLVVAVPAYLSWPTRFHASAWQPQPAHATPAALHSDALARIQRLAVGIGRGPEGIAVEPPGSIYAGSVIAGYADGRVIRLSADGAHYETLGKTPGRPLGTAATADGGIFVADGVLGLVSIGPDGGFSVLTDGGDGIRFGFPDDLDASAQGGPIYFTDASSQYRYPDYFDDILEHGDSGRLLAYDPATRRTRVLLKNLHFANGVALGPDDDYVLVNETGSYRIVRYWLKGPKAGTHDIFADGLPGFPDNLSFNGHDRFWVAVAAPRDALLDRLAPHPFLRRLLSRLPQWLLPQPSRMACVLAYDLDGRLVAVLRDAGANAYAPITSVVESGPWLWFGSKDENAIGRIPLRDLFSNAPAPPAGWQRAPAKPELVVSRH